MSTDPSGQSLPPEQCATMAQVRLGVDETDRAILNLLERRFGYMHAAARIKQRRDLVRDEGRKAQVIEAARAQAQARALPDAEIAALWERLVEISIAYELAEWERLNG